MATAAVDISTPPADAASTVLALASAEQCNADAVPEDRSCFDNRQKKHPEPGWHQSPINERVLKGCHSPTPYGWP